MEPLEKLTVLMTLMRRLQSVMEQEVALLRQMRIDELTELQDEKTTLSEAYEIEMSHLRRTPEILGSLDIEHRRALEEEARSFQQSVRENTVALQAASEVIERMMGRLADSLSATQTSGPAYGTAAPATGRIISVAFDRQL